MTDKNVLIIGAGPAGLTAAYELLKNSKNVKVNVTVLEATDTIGGISRTVNHNGNRMDIGGHRFFSKSAEVNTLWDEIMPLQGKQSFDDKITGNVKPLSENGPDPEKEDSVMLIRTRVSRIYFLKKFFAYPITLSAETIKNMGLLRTVKAGFGYIKACIFKKNETNLKNFYINRFGKPLYEMFFEDYTEKLWGVNPEFISAEWGAQRVKGLSLWGAVWNFISKPFKKNSKKVETSLIEQFKYPKKGPGQLWEAFADEIKKAGGEIILNSPVTKIKTENNKIVSVISNGKEFFADDFISSMPIKDLVDGMNDVPEDVARTAHNLPYRDFITVGLLLDKLEITNKTKEKTLGNIIPDCWIYVQERDVKMGRIQVFNNWSPYMVENPEKYVWVGLEYFCSEGDEMWNMSDDDFISMAENELCHIGVCKKESIRDAVRIKIKKAYPSYIGAYENFSAVKEYLDKFINLYPVGRNGQHRYNNMDHSMLTAMYAAEAIITGKNKNEIWNVNTEKEYHETAETSKNK